MHPDVYDEEMLVFLNKESNRNPFSFRALRFTKSVEESKELNFLKTPSVIIAASGMMEHGRILHHLRNRIADHRNTILVTGWQAPQTLGRKIVDGVQKVNIFGDPFRVRAKVEVLTGFSGHADENELLAWAGAMKKQPEHTFIVHGEEEAARILKDRLATRFKLPNIAIPDPHQEFEI
jgi:metallo-beta-lactamase family protein